MAPGATTPSPALPASILDEAADWILRLREGALDDAEQQALLRWQSRSPGHALAWRRAQDLMGQLDVIPAGVASRMLDDRARGPRRRGLGRSAGVAIVLGALALGGVQAWRHAANTSTVALDAAGAGPRQAQLADGTELTANTSARASARLDSSRRRIHLASGELYIHTGHDPQGRPFDVQTAEGLAVPLGTRFVVRQEDRATVVEVLSGRVRFDPAQGDEHRPAVQAAAGESLRCTRSGCEPARPLAAADRGWTRARLQVDDRPLCDFVYELNRYRATPVACGADLAERHISGAFPLADTDRVVASVAASLGLRLAHDPDGTLRLRAP